MFMEERQQQLAAIISEKGNITITEIVERYEISQESARRDLRILEQKGLCKRTHGGAIKPVQIGNRPAPDRKFEELPVHANYDAIAKKAAAYIKPNDTVYLTGGSFGYLMLKYLPTDFSYTLVVNSVEIANRLRELENAEIYIAGGKMRPSASVVDHMALDFISRMHFDLSFLTGSGLTAEFGLSNGTAETAAFQRKVVENSRKNILLLPNQKVGMNAFIKVCDVECFDTLITDWECVEDEVAKIEEKGVEVIIVENEP